MAAAFVEPPWDEPLDAERVIAAIPASATIAGMFFAAAAPAATPAPSGDPRPACREQGASASTSTERIGHYWSLFSRDRAQLTTRNRWQTDDGPAAN
jgi:hypothetical protein